MRQNIQDWLELDEGDPGFQLLRKEELSGVRLFLFIFISTIIRGFSPPANYSDRATAACRRS
jgi:hypothetical protein